MKLLGRFNGSGGTIVQCEAGVIPHWENPEHYPDGIIKLEAIPRMISQKVQPAASAEYFARKLAGAVHPGRIGEEARWDRMGNGLGFPWPKRFIVSRIIVPMDNDHWTFRIGEKDYYGGRGPADIDICSLADTLTYGILIPSGQYFHLYVRAPRASGEVSLGGILLQEIC